MLLAKKCQFFSLFKFDQNKPRKLTKQNFSKSRKSHFSKVLTHAQFTIDKKRLEILLGDFAEKKETSFYYKKQNFSKSKKSHFFPNGLIHSLNFIRLLRVVITPSVVERRKRLEAIG